MTVAPSVALGLLWTGWFVWTRVQVDTGVKGMLNLSKNAILWKSAKLSECAQQAARVSVLLFLLPYFLVQPPYCQEL
jgi:hypothetical protein